MTLIATVDHGEKNNIVHNKNRRAKPNTRRRVQPWSINKTYCLHQAKKKDEQKTALFIKGKMVQMLNLDEPCRLDNRNVLFNK